MITRTLTEDEWADLAQEAFDRMSDARVAVVLMSNGHNVGCHSFPGEILTEETEMIRLLVGMVCHLATANRTSPLRISVGLTSVIEQLMSAGRMVTRPDADGQMVTMVAGPNGESSAGPGGVGLGVIEGGRPEQEQEQDTSGLDFVASKAMQARLGLRVVHKDGEPEE